MRTNKYTQECSRCGAMIKPGMGELYQWFDDDEEKSVWLVRHLDPNICEENKAAYKKAEQERQEKERAREAEEDALILEMERFTGQKEQIDWSWDDYSFSVGETLKETEHFRAHRYSRDGEVIGFVIKDKDRRY